MKRIGIARIAVTGSSGLIGTALVRSLRADGHEVIRLVRRPARSADEVEWDPRRQYVDAAGLAGCDAVVHLAGAGVGERRWNEAYKKEIRDSRVLGTAAVAEAVASLDVPPKVLLCGTALGYYGDTGTRAVDETAPAGDGFLPSVCVEWEEAAAAAEEAGIRVAYARTGLVVAREGGAWGRLFPLFRAGLGGRLGTGEQYWSFISLHDEVAALRHILDTESLAGPVNLTAPDPVTNREVTAAMGRVLRRPAFLHVPAPALRIALGDFASDVLGSQRVVPSRLLDSGFRFAFPTIDTAIASAT
ncbi:TIGR01777 family protein [Streptomyces sp. WAC05374]|uniref:TIGR01777 family oxidoreductase n=1 Tax=Streptomyces sp. WAC05374 TaxID=2487420 RepID=UPI000F88514B|nr:TIGR01777 family oxidoreductase [Streptomyces sp. WAC05374]RST13535.1 TIGR01777 family protein [Streptomyces sp. WAC05374]TDF47607.1 TIGR01777 family protein [Streptomyces sp. WAC05374]TDF48615.1 TIGR01777 family protein [Streptomyces sp. WAC05374]TDF59135.1 TIGR01777 family protein [Streptomyces sp. WAC05374]